MRHNVTCESLLYFEISNNLQQQHHQRATTTSVCLKHRPTTTPALGKADQGHFEGKESNSKRDCYFKTLFLYVRFGVAVALNSPHHFMKHVLSFVLFNGVTSCLITPLFGTHL